jgi:ABC-type glycerol-3-phosphate transport system substrate-binding protein
MDRTKDRAVTELSDAYVQGAISRRVFIQRLLALGLTTSVAGSILAACSPSSPSASAVASAIGPAPSLDSNVSAKIRFLAGPVSGQELDNQQVIAAAFNEVYPNVEFSFDLFEWGTDDVAVQTSAVDGLHDIYYLAEARYVTFNGRDDLFADLGAVINDPAWASEKDKYVFWDRTAALGPRMIGFPVNWHVEQALYTNMDMLEQAGYGPEFVESWDSFADALRKMTKPDVMGIDVLASAFGGWYGRLRSAGADYLTADLSSPAINTPEVIEVTQQMVDLFLKDKTAAPPGTFDYDSAQAAFLSQQLAITSMDASRAAAFATDASFKWDMFPWPPGPKARLTFNDSNYWAVGTKSPAKDVAIEVIKFWTSAEQVGRWSAASGTYPMRSDSQEVMTESGAAPQLVEAFDPLLEHACYQQVFDQWGTIEGEINRQIQRAYLGEVTAEEAVTNFEQIVRDIALP